MRVAHVITRLILGGAQENTILNCQDLARDHGDEVVLITGPGLGPEGSLEDDARARGIRLEIIPSLRRNIHPWHDAAAYRAIGRALSAFQPNVVHTHSGKAGLFGRAAARRRKVPAIVHTVHGAPFHSYQSAAARAFFRRCEIFAAARCHAMISVADAMTDQLVAAGVAPRDKFTTIYSGMDVESFLAADGERDCVRRQLGYAPEDVVVGKAARLFHLKGHADLVAAARSACRENPRLKFLLVGDGILRPEIESQIAAAGLTDRFQFTGLVPPQRIAELLSATDLVVHTSLREGLARVLPQALLVGRPVISYDVDGAREVVRDNKTGFLVQPGDVATLAARIVQLSTSPELRARLAAAGRELCRTRFDHHEMTRQIRSLYERTLAADRTFNNRKRGIN
ncbi:MAG TPA: glycosyltransferase family 4 protein [Lacipirellulaceae bacterium]|jgi:glycosyltransferase involved in cell wall biosynthesis